LVAAASVSLLAHTAEDEVGSAHNGMDLDGLGHDGLEADMVDHEADASTMAAYKRGKRYKRMCKMLTGKEVSATAVPSPLHGNPPLVIKSLIHGFYHLRKMLSGKKVNTSDGADVL
jgi:hypothetical protein